MPAWLLAIVSHWSTKTVAIILGVGIFIGSYYFTYKFASSSGYRAGYAKSLKDNPPNVYTGVTTVNQQPCSSPTVYGLDIGKWAFGLIHKK